MVSAACPSPDGWRTVCLARLIELFLLAEFSSFARQSDSQQQEGGALASSAVAQRGLTALQLLPSGLSPVRRESCVHGVTSHAARGVARARLARPLPGRLPGAGAVWLLGGLAWNSFVRSTRRGDLRSWRSGAARLVRDPLLSQLTSWAEARQVRLSAWA